MQLKDRVYVKRRDGDGYWIGEIDHIEQDIATICGIDYIYSDGKLADAWHVRRKLKEEDMMYKQWAYWEK